MIIRWEITLGLLLVLISIAIGKKDLKPQQNSKCPLLTDCPFRAEQCFEDDDCAADSICCKSPCGKICTKQLFTGCETLRMAASRRAKSLGVENRSVRMPRCDKKGGFERIQCDNEIVSSCWCVDEAGFELPGTRAPAEALVNCSSAKPCADYTCRMFCPYGFALTKEGCPLCKCRDPCNDIECPNALQCHLEELACADPPCPPIPTCKKGRSLENVCPLGDPLRISETVRPFLCGNDPGKPTCPPMYQCLVQPGNDYGVCCPASLSIKKTGSCPGHDEENLICGPMCGHDLECPSVQKCCETEQCGFACLHPKNVTECYHQRALSELLTVSERSGRGYIPQCTEDGQFESKQCSRNGLVCWCVDRLGRKLKGSMGSAEDVNCTLYEGRDTSVGRSLDRNGKECEPLECAAVCEYGFKIDENSCPTCKCDDPCEGFNCADEEECINVKEPSCTDFLCPTLPVCRPKALYGNPCEIGTPLLNDLTGNPLTCNPRSRDGGICPDSYTCRPITGSTESVCCPVPNELQAEASEDFLEEESRQTMCEYLRDFTSSMEGTREDMHLALPSPKCDQQGNYLSIQCHDGECWCVDHFGTELPNTRAQGNSSRDCDELRESMDCLEATCRMGCDYGFVLDSETGCPTCQCKDPCSGVKCGDNEHCQFVEVSCKDHYCPPVPACLPKKSGQCPYLMPATSMSCEFECNSDMTCNGTTKCCSNGCGTQCIEPLLLTACEHQRLLAQHQAHESGRPIGRAFIPSCKEDGTFESKQCHPGRNECWCVDHRGFEVSQTRSSSKDLQCDSQKSHQCPLFKCVKDCEHGFELNSEGCRTCQCVDPCSKITCRGEGEACRLVPVECVGDGECPSVPMCLPKKENPCQTGEPLKLGSSDEVVTCGPEYESCPSSHKCQLSPLGEYAVCCPKPRDVCFEGLDHGNCGNGEFRNSTRYYFNSLTNRCEQFSYAGCKGNHNNFYTEDMCMRVCPVLTQCERLREKNERAAVRYNKPTFSPRCDPKTGVWQSIQCLEHVGVCWCVSPQGEPLKGTLTRGSNPECNFRQARHWASDRSDITSDADLVLEELMMQIGSLDDEEEPLDSSLEENSPTPTWMIPGSTRCEALKGQCDNRGKYLPMQCEDDLCWCVDEAGNQLSNTNTFKKGLQTCSMVPVEKVEVVLGFRGEFDDVSSIPVVNKIRRIIKSLKGIVNSDGISTELTDDALFVKFSLIGSNKVDVAFRLEQMVMQQQLPGLTADITRSRIIHRLFIQPSVEQVASMEHREIVSQSPVSVVAPYHTALIVVAAASAFVISVLTLLVILYRRKMQNLNNKEVVEDARFMSNRRPIYIELPNEKYNSISTEFNPTEPNPP